MLYEIYKDCENHILIIYSADMEVEYKSAFQTHAEALEIARQYGAEPIQTDESDMWRETITS